MMYDPFPRRRHGAYGPENRRPRPADRTDRPHAAPLRPYRPAAAQRSHRIGAPALQWTRCAAAAADRIAQTAWPFARRHRALPESPRILRPPDSRPAPGTAPHAHRARAESLPPHGKTSRPDEIL